MSTHREIEEVYKEDLIKKSKMINKYWSDSESIGEIAEAQAGGSQSDFSWCRMCAYFILDEESDAVKIGRTSGSVVDRMVELQVGNPNKLRIIGVIPKWSSKEYAEKELHRKFKDLNIHGEWFRYESEIKSFIQNLPEYCQQEESP